MATAETWWSWTTETADGDGPAKRVKKASLDAQRRQGGQMGTEGVQTLRE